jgi:acetyl-CoA acetyltransferase
MNRRLSDQDIVVLRGARTSFGNFGGALKDITAVEAIHG